MNWLFFYAISSEIDFEVSILTRFGIFCRYRKLCSYTP